MNTEIIASQEDTHNARSKAFIIAEKRRRMRAARRNNTAFREYMQCQDIIDQALKILSDWSKTRNIKLQIQYAAAIIGKIDNLKKIDYIRSNDTRKKICTLLKNVIRINVADIVFSRRQIFLLEKGFSLLLSKQIQKKDMLQLNREFLEQQLMTMPPWE